MKTTARRRHPVKTEAPAVKGLGQDTVVIRNDAVVERFSSLYKSLMNLEAGEPPAGAAAAPPAASVPPPAGAAAPSAAPVPPLTDREEDFFRRILGRVPSDGRYVIRRQLAQGGMGVLYTVHDRDLERDTVMKVLLSDLKKDESLIRAFLREARITAQLEHPNIVPVHDVGYLPEHGIYFTMKQVQGESLNDILFQIESNNPQYTERFDYFTLLGIFRKVCDAVAYAHAHHILHRDIKPHNIMVGDFGEVFLMDWGLAKRLGEATTEVPLPTALRPATGDTSGLVLKGSPGYMSPEQAGRQGVGLDERSDVFLLGATLYHLFTFFPPYLGASITTILANARECDYLRPAEVCFGNMHIPAELSRVIAKCMAFEKQDRYQSVRELAAELDAILHGRLDAEHEHFQPGAHLIREGNAAGPCYVIIKGRVEVYKGEGAERTQLSILGAGDIVGEMALITHRPRSASVVALDATEVMPVNQELFGKSLARLPQWLQRTVSALALRLGEVDVRLVDGDWHRDRT